MKTLEAGINKLWRQYIRLYPPEIRRWLQAEMPRLIAHADSLKLADITGEGLDCGHHMQVLAGFRDLVQGYWRIERARDSLPPAEERLNFGEGLRR